MKYLIVSILVIFILVIESFPPDYFISAEDAINSVDKEIDADHVYLNIHLNKEITCSSAIEVLGVESFYVEEELYKPYCTKPKPLLIQITFKKSVNV